MTQAASSKENGRKRLLAGLLRVFPRVALVIIAIGIIYYRLEPPPAPPPEISWWSESINDANIVTGLDPGLIIIDPITGEYQLLTWSGHTVKSGQHPHGTHYVAVAGDVYLLGNSERVDVYRWPGVHLYETDVQAYGKADIAAICRTGRTAVGVSNEGQSLLYSFTDAGTLEWSVDLGRVEIITLSFSSGRDLIVVVTQLEVESRHHLIWVDRAGQQMWTERMPELVKFTANSPGGSVAVAVTRAGATVIDSKGVRWSVETSDTIWGATIKDNEELFLLKNEEGAATVTQYRNGRKGWTSIIGGSPASISLINGDHVVVTTTTAVQLDSKGVPRWVADIPDTNVNDPAAAVSGGATMNGGFVWTAEDTLWVYFRNESTRE